MSHLRRWSDEDATEEERALLASARSEWPARAAYASTLVALGLDAAVVHAAAGATSASAGAAGSAASGGTAVTATAATLIPAGLVVKLAAVALLLGGAAAGGAWYYAGRSGVPAVTTPAPARAATAAAAIEAGRPPTEAPAPVAAAPEARVRAARTRTLRAAAGARRPAPRAEQPPPGTPALSDEVALLDAAGKALGQHDPALALHRLDAYRAAFPSGALASEATVLRVRALLAAGAGAEAAALADSFSAAHPDSPFARRLRALVLEQRAE